MRGEGGREGKRGMVGGRVSVGGREDGREGKWGRMVGRVSGREW